ncbi:MAG: DUF2490 domain-containing protein [Marinilabiliaceae bacterium]|nr:DUF2490 domain-containing protein [Marinilabiliaceae bacterium]
MKKRVLLTVALAASAAWAAAQTDLGVWTELDGEYAINKKWDVGINAEVRTRDFLSGFDRYSIGVSTDFAPTKILSFGAGYFFIDSHKDSYTTKKGNIVDDYWRIKNRFYLQTKLKFKPSILTIGVRLRYQHTKENEVSIAKYSASGVRKSNEVKEANSDNILRTKFSLSVKATKLLRPYVGYELSNNLDGFSLEKQRFEVGTDFKLNKYNTIGIGYKRNIYSDDDDDKTHNVLSVSYKLSM